MNSCPECKQGKQETIFVLSVGSLWRVSRRPQQLDKITGGLSNYTQYFLLHLKSFGHT